VAKILIVDDQELNVDLLEQELEDLGYETCTAYDGEEALEQVAAESPDCILLDVMMPKLSGFEVCERLKSNPETQLTPILIMTALSDVEDRVKGIQAGADDFLTKPVDSRELKARIETALKMKAAVEGRIQTEKKVGQHYANFVPESVKKRVEENPEAPNLDKRDEDASVLFLDICGYTALSEQMPPDDLNSMVEKYFGVFLDRLHDFGGEITETSGDGLMVLFQDDDPGQHANKAVEAALALMDETRQLNENDKDHPDIYLHMGVNSGLASVGSTVYEGKNSQRWVFTADGLMTNMAARLANAAQPGEIYLGPETTERVRQRYEMDDCGDHSFKNIAEPVRVHKVLERKSDDE
jgi:DNA-binding response OmpR family regulator